MLKLQDIKKDYKVAETTVHALKGVSITFRENEFVSILGPSGCGKTTLLNIIGGLDHYNDGDLIIDGVSTKNYNDRDWDTYRNHRIGFIFQSYNLIPHQTILENVELALVIAGMEKEERLQKAKDALDKVGLEGQYNKKPNQLSGGQCQRVAIARALVNEPEILLADEPTGALDTKTSIQIMDLIKEIAKDRLVIMVTHNPEIASKYSTRIIRLLDGKVVDDSNPVLENEITEDVKDDSLMRKSKLGLWTTFKLSARNLISKLKRTLMVSLAGSIGIIGVACVLAVSNGVTMYINDLQNDMLSGNPIQILEETIDLDSMMSTMTQTEQGQVVHQAIKDGYIGIDFLVEFLIKRGKELTNMMITNEIDELYIEYLNSIPEDLYAAMVEYYGINIRNNIYTEIDFTNQNKPVMSLNAIKEVYTSMLSHTDYSDYSDMILSLANTFKLLPNSEEFILSQYEFISSPEISHIAKEADEIMIVVDKNNQLSDLVLAQLGYLSQEQFFNIIYRGVESELYDPNKDIDYVSYDELLGKEFTWYPNDVIFEKNTGTNSYNVPYTYKAYVDETFTSGKKLKITGILKPKENLSYGALDTGVYYTEALTKEILADSLQSEIVNYVKTLENQAIVGMRYQEGEFDIVRGVTYNYQYTLDGVDYNDNIGFVGSSNAYASIMEQMGMQMPDYYTLSLRDLGGVAIPNGISIYPNNFDDKDVIRTYLDKWNSDEVILLNGREITKEMRTKIVYTDALSLVMSMVNTMISIITTALIAFTALSLIVSTVMIAIITYVSVIERVKEIGVIRSLGGRKKDVSRLFTVETFIIGLSSGLMGVGVTYLISFIANLIIGSISELKHFTNLPISQALIMIAISVILTLISGVIPAKFAAKKDPVDALRTE